MTHPITPATTRARIVVLSASFIIACGGGPKGKSAPVVIQTNSVADVTEPAVLAARPRSAPIGANGPRDAVAIVGPAGRVLDASSDTLFFVNSSAIRTNPNVASLRHVVNAAFVGWRMFMPFDLVDPLDDVDWTVTSGSLFVGSTEDNLILAHYNITESQLASVETSLLARLARATRGTPPVMLTAHVDHAPRAYIHPNAGVFGIVPPNMAADVSTFLAPLRAPTRVRPGELARVILRGPHGRLLMLVPRSIRDVRIWITAVDGGALRLSAEGDCESPDVARESVEAVQSELARQPAMARIVAGPLLARSNVWADGARVFYDAPLDARLLEAVAELAGCRPVDPCAN